MSVLKGAEAELAATHRKILSMAEEVGKTLSAARVLLGELESKSPFKHIKIPDGWKITEPGPARRITDVSKLEFTPILKEGEDPINGEVMRERAKEKGCDYGLEDLDFFLDHQDEIPKEFRDPNIYLVFPGAVLEDSSRDRYVACLVWDDGRWCLDFFWLDSDCYSDCRFLSLGKPDQQGG